MTLPGKISPMTGALTAKPPSPAGEAREFLPAALEILETPANPAGRALALLLAAMFVAAICWAVIGKVDVVAVAPGRTVPVGGSKLIQPLELGTVRAIHVSDGQKVTAGQILVELDPTEAEVDLDQLRQQHVEQALEAARLSAYIAVLLGDPQPFAPRLLDIDLAVPTRVDDGGLASRPEQVRKMGKSRGFDFLE